MARVDRDFVGRDIAMLVDYVSPQSGVSRRAPAIWLGCAAAVAVGIGLRLAQYLSNQSFYVDESALLLNVLRYPAHLLPFTRLDAITPPQAAPPLLLLWCKAMLCTFGLAEWAVRLLPQLLALVALPLMWIVSRRFLQPAVVLWAMWLMALSDLMIWESAVIKPYSGDVLIGLLIFASGLVWKRGSSPAERLTWASLLTAAGLWVSYTAVFVFAAVALALMPTTIRRRGWLALIGGITPAFISFGAAYMLSFRAERNPRFLDFSDHLNRLGDWHHAAGMALWAIRMAMDMFHGLFSPKGAILAAPAALGVWVLRHRIPVDVWWALLLLPAISLMVAAAGFYPTGGTRLTMYLAPFLIIFIAAGCEEIVRWTSRTGVGSAAWCRAGFMLLILAPQWGPAIYRLVVPRSMGNTRDALAFVRSRRVGNEPVYVIGHNHSVDVELYWPDADPAVHLDTNVVDKPSDSEFWVLTSSPEALTWMSFLSLQQGNAKPDAARSFHVRGGDAVFYLRENSFQSRAAMSSADERR